MSVRGTRLRHINGNNLLELEQLIEALPYKVQLQGINLKPNGNWFIHFTILDEVTYAVQNDPKVLKTINKKQEKKGIKK